MVIFILLGSLFLISPIFAHPGDLFYQKAFHYQKQKEYQKALPFFRSAAKLKHPEALSSLGRIYLMGLGMPKSLPEGLKLLKQSAALDHLPALLSLGQIYRDGLFDVPIDLAQAKHYFTKAKEISQDPEEKQAITQILTEL
jgi:TPR repeat protein